MSSSARVYRAHRLQNASGPESIVACFEEAGTHLVRARRHLGEGATASGIALLEKVRRIYTHLYSTLDLKSGEDLAVRMQSVYAYVIGATLEIESTCDLNSLSVLEQINADMLGAWSQIARRQNPPAESASGPSGADA